MRAEVGDNIVVRGRRVGQPNRRGRIVAVRGDGGGPPYVVRWDDDPQDHLYYPGSDALIES